MMDDETLQARTERVDNHGVKHTDQTSTSKAGDQLKEEPFSAEQFAVDRSHSLLGELFEPNM